MKALVITRLTGPDALEVRDVAEPEPKPGQTLVRVSACGLNFADLMTTRGGYPGAPAPPLIAGREFAGVEISTGRRVMGYAQYAAFAEKLSRLQICSGPVPTTGLTNKQQPSPSIFLRPISPTGNRE